MARMRQLIGLVRLILKCCAYILLCLLVTLIQWPILQITKGRLSYYVPQLYHRLTCWMAGLKVHIQGTPITDTDKHVLFISNHISYLDIPALGYFLRASFVAKKDIRDWPVYGFLGSLQQTAYISRAKTDVAKETHSLQTMLDDEDKNLIVFPEGTSSDGSGVLPFKSSLFALPLASQDKDNLLIQPITIRIESVDGKALTHHLSQDEAQALRDLYAWYGEMELIPHLPDFFKLSGAEITLIFHDPIAVKDYDDRKTLAQKCHNIVENGLTRDPETGKTGTSNDNASRYNTNDSLNHDKSRTESPTHANL